MTGKDLLLTALRHQPLPRVPWLSFTGIHAARLKGYTTTEMLLNADKLVASLLEANARYQPDGQRVVFDLQVEAEILGCKLAWADKISPTVVTHPLALSKTIPTHTPAPTEGRLPIILEAMRQMKTEVGDRTALFGTVCGPFTLASHLRSTGFFIDMFDNPEYVHDLIACCARVCKQTADYYIDAGMDVIAIVDPLMSQLAPTQITRFLSAPYTDLFAHLRNREVNTAFFVRGKATRNIELICKTGPDSIFIDEKVDMPAAKCITNAYNITLGGNIPMSTTLLSGTQQDNMQHTLGLLDSMDHQNLIVAPSCNMHYDPERVRKMLTGYQQSPVDIDVQLPDYKALSKPLIEVVTLDSATCPVCTNVMDVVKVAQAHFGDQIDVVEYKIVEPQNIPRVQKMGIQNLPAIVINGKLAFSSLIPGQRGLVSRIEQTLSRLQK